MPPRGDNNVENNSKDNKDVGLLLLTDTSADTTSPTPPRAALQKIFIDDRTKRCDASRLKRQRLWRVPWFILLMCFMQLSLHLIANECMHRRLIYKPEWSHEYWRLISYMLLHADAWHLTLNICLQCFIGVCLELEQGHCRLAVVYFAGGLAGALANAWLQPHLLLLGASAGVYAMLFSHVPHLVLNFHQLSHRFARIAALLILFLSDVGFTAFHFRQHHNRNPRISLEAHLGGGVAGLLCGFIVYRRVQQKSNQKSIYL
ncbi:protein rhomboid [Drosophila guanche]|uniref:Blast:Protein rhomboid n=1 Tax=Drosophila guanche TaxID=7266 RepID=A0A3B0JB36_DROGU|nr:protein rhomboid [Drosophila guanche]SPP79225.1 blast:Protein rhomboid [Drosophila guanche]